VKVHILKRHGAPAERRRPLGVIDHVQSHERIDLSSGSVPSSAVITASEIDVSSSDYDEMSMTGEDSDREEGDIDELNPHQQSTTIWPDPRAQTVEENDIFTVVGIPNLDPTTRVRASYELIYWSLHDPADPEQRFWLFDYDTVKASTSSSSSELFISIKASIIEYPIGRQLSETEIKLTALNHSSGLTLLSVLEHRNKSQMKAGPNLSRATTIDFADSSANPSGSNSAGLPPKMIDRPMNEPSVWPDHSSYWSVSELQDFDKNIAHFGTDWHAIASNMPTKTHPMVKTQYLRLVEQGRADLEQAAREADSRRERGDYLGPPPIPTPAPERRYEGIQTGTLGASYRHGDLMPENILVFEEGGPIGKLKIEDWGEAKYQGKNTAIRAGKTTTRFGNKRYEAPEVETAVDTAEHASATSNATEEKPESAQSTAQTQLAPEHAADMSTESRDTKADRLEQPIFSCTVKAHIGVGSPDSLDLSLLTEARLTLFPTYYELKQNSETHVWYYSDAWRMNIRGRTISIGRYFDTLFLRAASRRDVDAITEILSEEIPSVKNFDNGKSDSYVAGQHVDNASSSEDDMESEMNIGAERTSRTTKAVLAQLNKTSEANRRTSVDSDVFSPSDAPELQGEQQEEDMQEPHESRFLRRTDSERLQELLDEYEQGEGREEVAKIRRPKGQSFTRTMDLERHFLNKHAQEKPEYWCPILGCDRSDSKGNPFPRKDKMEDHIRTRHPDYEGLDEYHFGAVAARKTTDASAERSQSGPKGILRPPTKTFPEDPEPIREGVAPHKDSVRGKDVPVNARWTKIDRRLVNPEALEEAKERFEERMDCIIVLRVLTKEEIQKLADRTKEIRERRGTSIPFLFDRGEY
jgi:serine/threonine protein kinase